MYEISYIMIFRLYDKYREPLTGTNGESLMPMIDNIKNWLPDEVQFKKLNKMFSKEFSQKLYG
jgi:hypothetical protein